jgi:ABC-type nitrate/sulfonate/bicarbonate transport system substrate-binding protein
MVNLLHVGRGSSSGIPLSIAEKHGFFEKHGLDVRVLLVPGTQVPQLTGETPLGFIGAPAALLRAADGADLRIVASFNTARIFSQVVVRSDIKKVENLCGKRFGVRALGAGAWIETIVALEHLGLDPKRDDISVLAIGDSSEIARAIPPTSTGFHTRSP